MHKAKKIDVGHMLMNNSFQGSSPNHHLAPELHGLILWMSGDRHSVKRQIIPESQEASQTQRG